MGRELAARVAGTGEGAEARPVDDDEDARLVASARADPEAFVALYRRYVGPVHRYLLGQVGHRADAEDLTATVFAKALAAPPRRPSSPRPSPATPCATTCAVGGRPPSSTRSNCP